MNGDVPHRVRIHSENFANPAFAYPSPPGSPPMERSSARQPYASMRRRVADPYSSGNGPYEKSPFLNGSHKKPVRARGWCTPFRSLLLITLLGTIFMLARSWGLVSVLDGRNGLSAEVIKQHLEQEYHSRIEGSINNPWRELAFRLLMHLLDLQLSRRR